MPNIIYAGSASAPGASVSFSSALELEGYNSISVKLVGTTDPTTPTTVIIDLGTSANTIKLLAIKPTPANAALNYQLDPADGASPKQVLDQPLLLAGTGALAAYATVTKLRFNNAISPKTDVKLEILVGRDPTS